MLLGRSATKCLLRSRREWLVGWVESDGFLGRLIDLSTHWFHETNIHVTTDSKQVLRRPDVAEHWSGVDNHNDRKAGSCGRYRSI